MDLDTMLTSSAPTLKERLVPWLVSHANPEVKNVIKTMLTELEESAKRIGELEAMMMRKREMDPGTDIDKRLVEIGLKIKAKGWESASINIYVHYLAMFDRELGPHDPMISCRPSITASTRDRYGAPTSHEFVRDGWDCKTIEQAVAKLDAAADAMPTKSDEEARIESVKSKLSDEDRRLLGVR